MITGGCPQGQYFNNQICNEICFDGKIYNAVN